MVSRPRKRVVGPGLDDLRAAGRNITLYDAGKGARCLSCRPGR